MKVDDLEEKFLVLKYADIYAALSDYELRIFKRMVACVGEYRASQGKAKHQYVVINLDEPYADQVVELMDGTPE